ncbi:hypothetical protein Dsin_018107 [Dipteronia sinensis]|uniref:DUF1985 domain-containing protein n=1 Tax=Dipteronia sinensis TaxID=43782 RepID=A0AAE0AG96_9ROSI|nr:hypothetical protein Dsin_018107 [Dipteronia sinensis]
MPERGYFQAQYMHNLFLRQITPLGVSMNEMWFALGKTKVRLGAREFCLYTSLKFGELIDIFLREYQAVPNGIHFRYFGGSCLLVDNIIDMFLAKSFKRPGDALKIALVLFVNYILFGVDERTPVSYWLMTLVEDTNAFNKFAWGHYVFKMTLHYIRQGFRMPDLTGPTCRYNLYGFVWGVQFLAMEAILVIRHKLGHYLGSGYPHFKKIDFITKASKMRESWLGTELEGKLTGRQELTPTKLESKQDYWMDVDIDMSLGPQFEPPILIGANERQAEPSRKNDGLKRKRRYKGPDVPANEDNKDHSKRQPHVDNPHSMMLQGIENIMHNKDQNWNWTKDNIPGLKKDMACNGF